MTPIPDFVQQTLEIVRQLDIQVEVCRNYWQDKVSERFYFQYPKKMENVVQRFLNGDHMEIVGDAINGKGLNDLLIYLQQKESEVDALCQDCTPYLTRDGLESKVDENRLRVDWYRDIETREMPDPSRLNPEDVNDIMTSRDFDW